MAAERRTGLLVDFGGVLTTDIFSSFTAFCETEGLEPDFVRDRFRSDPAAQKLLFELEEGKIEEEEFEPAFAELLGVADSARLIDRLFAGMQPDTAMLAAVAGFKRAGVRTGLISNSWGKERYDKSAFPELFHGTVISGEVGIRKPLPEIYEMGAEAIGLTPGDCVFVDDLPPNLKPAAELGMATVLHRNAERTIAELEEILDVRLEMEAP
jgi:putative hydrolase of the HAD superfamily